MPFLLLAAVAALASTPLATPPAPPPTPATGTEAGTAEAGPAGETVQWAQSFPDAVARARAMPHGRILVEFTETGCETCAYMARLIHPSTSFYAFTRDKVPVQVSRNSDEGKKLAQELGVSVVPAWVVLTPERLVCGFQEGTTSQSGWIQTFVETERSWAEYLHRLDEERERPGDTDLVFAVAQETFKRLGDGLAEPRFRRLSTDPKATPEIREKSLAYLATIELDSGRLDEAAADLKTLAATTKDPVLRERSELRLADIEIGRGNRAGAIDRLEQFKKDHPVSPRIPQVDELLNKLRGSSTTPVK